MRDLLQSFGALYAPDDSNTGGGTSQTGTAPGQQAGNSGAPQPENAHEQTGTAPGQQAGNRSEQGDTLTVTKNDLDKRIEKAKRSGVREVLQALGFADLDTPDAIQQAQESLADLVKFAREQRAAQMTAEERVKQQVQEAEHRATAAEAKLKRAEARAQAATEALLAHVRDGAVLAAASKAKHPDDVLIWARTYAADKLAKVVDAENLFTEDGAINREAIKVNEDAVKDIVTACMQSRRDWFAVNVPGSPSNAGGKPPGSITDIEKRLQIARRTARL